MADPSPQKPSEHFRYFWEYLCELLTDWKALMSGIASIVCAFWAAYRPPTGEKAKVLLWLAAGICLILASYRIWLTERRRRGIAEAKLSRPLLTGFFQDTSASYYFEPVDEKSQRWVEGFFEAQKITGTIYAFVVRILNDSPVPTTLHNFSLQVESQGKRCIAPYPEEPWTPSTTAWSPPWKLEYGKNMLSLVTLLGTDKLVAQGVGIDGYLVFHLPGWGVDPKTSLPETVPDEGVTIFFTLAVEDAWGVRHLIKNHGPKPRPSRRLSPEYYLNRNTNNA
jgi:hypothetical protein